MQMKRKRRQKDLDLELYFFCSNSAFCLCEQKSYKCRRACNTMYARTFAMRATLSAAPLHLVTAPFNYQRGPMFFFLYVSCLHLRKLYLCLATKSNYNSSIFFFSLTLLLRHFRHERSTSQKSVFFFELATLLSYPF